jgi:hypothetical protein
MLEQWRELVGSIWSSRRQCLDRVAVLKPCLSVVGMTLKVAERCDHDQVVDADGRFWHDSCLGVRWQMMSSEPACPTPLMMSSPRPMG